MIPCPDFIRQVALREGVPPENVDELWASHIAFCQKNGIAEYGGGPWRSLVTKVAREGVARVPTVPRTDPAIAAAVAAAKRAEAEARALEEAEYQRGAITLPQYIASLRARADFSQPMTEAERRIMMYRDPYPGENPGAWLMAAISGVDT